MIYTVSGWSFCSLKHCMYLAVSTRGTWRTMNTLFKDRSLTHSLTLTHSHSLSLSLEMRTDCNPICCIRDAMCHYIDLSVVKMLLKIRELKIMLVLWQMSCLHPLEIWVDSKYNQRYHQGKANLHKSNSGLPVGRIWFHTSMSYIL